MTLPDADHSMWRDIATLVSERSGVRFKIKTIHALSGGCINGAARVTGGRRSWFVKYNTAERASMFEAEAHGLDELAATHSLRVPLPLGSGCSGRYSWLVLEHLDSLGKAATGSWENLGQNLARLHRQQRSTFGWLRDNTIGSTPQINTSSDDWVEFVRRYRLGFQLELAAANGYGKPLQARGQILLDGLDVFFADYRPEPSLVHGDLWSGNVGFLASGEPVIFDPATYYGDRESDIAMTELFGGFAPAFYRSYDSAWPLDCGYATRKHLYNLYHLLNHLNLFGAGYLAQCEATIDALLQQLD